MSKVEYTAEQTEEMVGRYVEAVESGATYDERSALVKQLAEELESTVASVRGKLVSEKVYVGKEKAKTASTDTKDKDAYVKALRAVTGLELKSVDKATKVDIQGLFDFIVQASRQQDAETGRDGT